MYSLAARRILTFPQAEALLLAAARTVAFLQGAQRVEAQPAGARPLLVAQAQAELVQPTEE